MRMLVFRRSELPDQDSRVAYYRGLFFENPWPDPDVRPIVAVDPAGVLVGFVGCVARPWSSPGTPLRGAICTEFMVSPTHRGRGVGSALLRELFDGPQDFTISDRVNDQARKVYELQGARLVPWASTYWSVSLRPVREAFSVLRGSAARKALRVLLAPLAVVLDGLSSPAPTPTDTDASPPTDADELALFVEQLARPGDIRPLYPGSSLSWLLDRLRGRPFREVITRVVRDSNGPIGSFVVAARADGRAELVHLGCTSESADIVFSHAVQAVARSGATTFGGRLDASVVPVITRRRIPLTIGNPWTMMHAREPSLCAAFLGGRTRLSRLDAEWWMGA